MGDKFSKYLSSPGWNPNLSQLTPTHWGLLTVPLQSKPGSPGSPGYIPMTSQVKSEKMVQIAWNFRVQKKKISKQKTQKNIIHLDFLLGKLPKTQSSPPKKKRQKLSMLKRSKARWAHLGSSIQWLQLWLPPHLASKWVVCSLVGRCLALMPQCSKAKLSAAA